MAAPGYGAAIAATKAGDTKESIPCKEIIISFNAPAFTLMTWYNTEIKMTLHSQTRQTRLGIIFQPFN